MAYAKDKWVRRFLIPETTRHRKGFTIYKVTSVVYARSSREEASKVSVWKRYNDFKKLHSELSSLYSRNQGKEPFPPFARPKFFARFEVEVIEERKQCALQLLEFISKYEFLYSSDTFIKFFETSHNVNFANDHFLSLSSDTSEDDHNNSSINNCTSLQCTVPSQSLICKNQGQIVSSNCFNVDDSSHEISCISNVKNVPDRINVVTSMDKDAANDVAKLQAGANNKNSVSNDDQQQQQLPLTEEDDSYYIFIAGAHMSAAFRHEAIAEYEEAFTQYKMAISNLLNGVQSDPDTARAETVKEKISKYLERAEKLYNRHLNCNVSLMRKPILELQYYKVLGVIKSVMLVRDVRDNCLRIMKTIERPADSADNISNYILRGQIPYMVKLYACIETDTAVYLLLQYASRGKLWDYVKSHYNLRVKSHSLKEHSHSFNCIPDSDISDDVQQGQRGKTPNDTSQMKIDLKCVNDTNARLEEIKTRRYGSRDDSDVSTAKLLEKAQKLLQSVNATLKKSNSIANRLNEYSHLVCHRDSLNYLNVHDDKNIIEQSKDEDCCKSKNEFSTTDRQCLTNNNSIDFAFSENRSIGHSSSNLESQSIDRFNEKSIEIKQSRMFNNIDANLSANNRRLSDEEIWQIPQATIRLWAAEILLALEALHQQEVIVADLRPDNILLDDNGHIRLTYIVPRYNKEFLKFKQPYSAPELCTFSPVIMTTTSADIWSFGVILYELLTGNEFQSKHSGSFHSHSIVNLPKKLSTSAKSLLNNVLKYEANDRFTIPEIKKHPFFDDLDWSRLLNP